MGPRVVPLYAVVLAVLFVVLSVNVIRGRNTGKLALGIGEDRDLERRVRVHANFAEYVPLALLLLLMAELRGAGATPLHLLGVALVLGRVSHAWGVSRPNEDLRFRVGGMAATFTVLLGAAALILVG